MKKNNKNNKVSLSHTNPEKACVGSSILSLGTNYPDLKTAQIIEIPQGWRVLPAVRWKNGKPKHFHVLLKTPRKRWERGGNASGKQTKSKTA